MISLLSMVFSILSCIAFLGTALAICFCTVTTVMHKTKLRKIKIDTGNESDSDD